MTEEKKKRRRRGRRGGQGRSQGEGAGDGQQPEASAPEGDGPRATESGAGGRNPRRDTRRGRPGGASSGTPADGPPSPSSPGIRRAPSAGDRGRPSGESRDQRGRRGGGDRDQRGGRPQRDSREGRDNRGPRRESSRSFEPPTPQDPESIELGQRFREAQSAVRDARKALDKRRAEFNDEPEWMLEQLAVAESRFEEASTAWVDHLEKTGRKIVRR